MCRSVDGARITAPRRRCLYGNLSDHRCTVERSAPDSARSTVVIGRNTCYVSPFPLPWRRAFGSFGALVPFNFVTSTRAPRIVHSGLFDTRTRRFWSGYHAVSCFLCLYHSRWRALGRAELTPPLSKEQTGASFAKPATHNSRSFVMPGKTLVRTSCRCRQFRRQ